MPWNKSHSEAYSMHLTVSIPLCMFCMKYANNVFKLMKWLYGISRTPQKDSTQKSYYQDTEEYYHVIGTLPTRSVFCCFQ